jgi:hypothetical protein
VNIRFSKHDSGERGAGRTVAGLRTP